MSNQAMPANGEASSAPQHAPASSRRESGRTASQITDPRLISISHRANSLVKRAFDIGVSASALVVLAPALAAVAVAIWAQDRANPFYGHTRIGRHGSRFRCWKFRSMLVNGDDILARHLADDPMAAAEWREFQKLEFDPRVTTLGKIIRKTSIDELPQLWNVLKGEMSIVGPRPITRPELDRYGKERRYYLLVRPGITGLWQVSGRSDTTYDERIKFDRDYFEQYTFTRDLWLILKTIPTVLMRKGAS